MDATPRECSRPTCPCCYSGRGELRKSAFYWWCLAGEGVELVNGVHKGEIDLPFLEQVVGVVRG